MTDINRVSIPAVLSQFSDELLSRQRSYVAIEATPLDCELNDDPLGLTQSKFLGKPFVPEGMAYPEDSQGNPLVLLAQINFSEIPELEGFPTDGLLQFYLSSSEWFDMSGGDKVVYLSGADLEKSPRGDLPDIEPNAYEELPIYKVHELRFKSAVDAGNSEDDQFDFDFDGEDFWDFEEGLSDSDKKEFNEYFSGEGHKIGGYAYFTQGDPRGYSEDQKDDVQLLQIDTDDEIMFGDSGIAHIFMSPEALARRDFSKAYFYWDCC